MHKVQSLELARISVCGVVQGVGFRPFVYQLANKYGLRGWVCNTSADVKIEVEGGRDTLEQFLAELQKQAPPLAHIESIAVTFHPPLSYKNFEIRHSIAQEGKYQLVSPDIATCQACLSEVLDPSNRRYRYPFTNCTNCGPRFTIIEDIPCDRPKTTMRSFQMCPNCQREYTDPLDRRFHAQPNACPRCGPQLSLIDNSGCPVTCSDIINTTCQLLKAGKIVAIKGLGGFLLACDATNEAAVKILRQRKRRPFKPLAIMVSDIEEAEKHCYVSEEEKKLLLSPQSPIVLIPWKHDSTVSHIVAPKLKYLGVILPYTPLHHLLLREAGLPLVMTSGNLSEEPIAKDNEEALRRLPPSSGKTIKLEEGRDLSGKELRGSPHFFLGASVTPGAEPLEPQLIKMEKKVKAGAQFFQTQTIYEPKKFEIFMNEAKKFGAPVLVGMVLIRSVAMARFMNKNVAGVHVPEELIDELDKAENKVEKSIEIAARLINEMKPVCQGVHIMAIGWEARVPSVLDAAGL